MLTYMHAFLHPNLHKKTYKYYPPDLGWMLSLLIVGIGCSLFIVVGVRPGRSRPALDVFVTPTRTFVYRGSLSKYYHHLEVWEGRS